MQQDTSSVTGVWKPANNGDSRKLGGPGEYTHLSLKSGGGAAYVSFYDGTDISDVKDVNQVWALDASTQDTDNEKFDGLIIKKGLFAVLEQGGGFNPVVCVGRRQL